MELQRVNMDIQKWIWEQVGITAIKEGMTKRELVEKALIKYTDNAKASKQKKLIGKGAI